MAYNDKGDNDRAIEDYTQAIRINQKYTIAYNNRGLAYYKKGYDDRAIGDYSQALRIDPNYADAYDNRGIVYDHKGDYDRAIQDYNQAIRLNPKDATAYNNRGWAYRNKGDFDRAIEDFNQAIRLDQKFALAYNNRAFAHKMKGDYDQTIQDCTKAIQLDAKLAWPYTNRGDAYEAKNRLTEALADFRRHLELEPGDADAAAAVTRIEEKIAATTAAYVPPPRQPPAPPRNEKRVALIFGESNYSAVPRLPNPERDAASIAEALRGEGFEVTVAANATRAQMVEALQQFQKQARQSDWALIYFAGHGVEIGGRNFLAPIDAKLESDSNAEDDAISLDRLETAVQGAKKLRLVLLDACRNNPFDTHMTRSAGIARAVQRGLAPPMEPEPGMLVVFATRAGTTADDGDNQHSPFAAAFLRALRRPGLEARRLFDVVRDDVVGATARRQLPFVYGSLPAEEDFYFMTQP